MKKIPSPNPRLSPAGFCGYCGEDGSGLMPHDSGWCPRCGATYVEDEPPSLVAMMVKAAPWMIEKNDILADIPFKAIEKK